MIKETTSIYITYYIYKITLLLGIKLVLAVVATPIVSLSAIHTASYTKQNLMTAWFGKLVNHMD